MFDTTPINTTRIFANALHTYVNYDAIAEDAHAKGAVMKEDRDHYAFTILSSLENKFKGMSKEDIELHLHLCSHLDK